MKMLIFLGSSMQNSSAMQLAVVGKSLPFVLAVSFSCTVAGTVKSCRQPGHADKAIEIVMFFFFSPMEVFIARGHFLPYSSIQWKMFQKSLSQCCTVNLGIQSC